MTGKQIPSTGGSARTLFKEEAALAQEQAGVITQEVGCQQLTRTRSQKTVATGSSRCHRFQHRSSCTQKTVLQLSSTLNSDDRQMEKPRLLVKLVRAHNLRNADWMGESDPYVKVTLGKEKKESKVIYNCLNPVWNEELMLPFRAPQDFDQRVRIDVIDWDPPPKYHDPLGHLDIPLQELRHHQELRVNENLIDGDKGRIELVISLLQ